MALQRYRIFLRASLHSGFFYHFIAHKSNSKVQFSIFRCASVVTHLCNSADGAIVSARARIILAELPPKKFERSHAMCRHRMKYWKGWVSFSKYIFRFEVACSKKKLENTAIELLGQLPETTISHLFFHALERGKISLLCYAITVMINKLWQFKSRSSY